MLKLNPSKCQALQVYFGQSSLQGNLRIGTEQLSCVTEAKVLGLYLQNNLKWDLQVDNMLQKANKRLFMLRSLKHFGFDRDELRVVYGSYVRPILEYADVVWHSGITEKQSKNIETIQKRACRTIMGNSYVSYNQALTTCKFDSLSVRREQHCRRFAEGLPSNERTKDLLPPTRFRCHGRSLRNNDNVSQFKFRTNRFHDSPIPYHVDLLNN